MAMDITEWHYKGEKKLILHMIDEFSRLSVAKFINNKRPEAIMKTVFTTWLCVFGTPKPEIHDKGGEFVNQRVTSFLNVMGVRILSTLAYSPFENGIVERQNGILKHTMNKMQCAYHTSHWNENALEMILAHAVHAKNATLTSAGYSAFMRTYGKDSRLIPGLETQHIRVADEWVEKRVNEIDAARKALIDAENEERIKQAMHRTANRMGDASHRRSSSVL